MTHLYALCLLLLCALPAAAQPNYAAHQGVETQVEISRELPNFVLYAYFNRLDSAFMPITAISAGEALPHEQFIAQQLAQPGSAAILHPCTHQPPGRFQTAHQYYLQYAIKWEENGTDLIAARITGLDTLTRSTRDYAFYLSVPTGKSRATSRPINAQLVHPDRWVQSVPLFLFQALLSDQPGLPFAHAHCQVPYSSIDLSCLQHALLQLPQPSLAQLLQAYSPSYTQCHQP